MICIMFWNVVPLIIYINNFQIFKPKTEQFIERKNTFIEF